MTRRLLLTLFLAAFAPAADSPVRVRLVTGGHSHDLSIYDVFRGLENVIVTVDGHPSAFRGDLRKSADVLVLYDMADVTDPKQQANVRNFVEAGKGVVALHHSLVSNQNWPWWTEEVLGGKYLQQEERGMPKSTFLHDVDFDVRPVAQHPILNGVGPFRIHDECYKGFWVSPRVKMLLETDHPKNERALAWIGPNEKFRVVYIQLGHGTEAHVHPIYRRLVANAIQWAAGKLN